MNFSATYIYESLLTPFKKNIFMFFAALSTVTTAVVFTLGGMAVLIVFALFADTLRHILKHGVPGTKSHTVYVVSIYPVSSSL
jgi:hypothetical protein